MKTKTTDLQGQALDWAVAKCEGMEYCDHDGVDGIGNAFEATRYSSDWAQGGPIIEREKLLIQPEIGCEGAGNAWYSVAITPHDAYGITPLIAAMRCFVASKLGDEIELPEELT